MQNRRKNIKIASDDPEELLTKGYLSAELDRRFKEQSGEFEKKIKKRFEEQSEEFERHVGAVLERSRDHVKIVAEGFAMQIEASERKWMSQEEVNTRHALRIARIEALCAQ